jgi:hypothetical protein
MDYITIYIQFLLKFIKWTGFYLIHFNEIVFNLIKFNQLGIIKQIF